MKKLFKKWSPVIFIVLVLVIWEITARAAGIPGYILPLPTNIFMTLLKTLPDLWIHSAVTLKEALIGLFFSILISIVLSVTMDGIPLIKRILYPIIVLSQTIPIIAFAPLFVIWFGFGIVPKIIVVVLVCFFPITVSLTDGMASADKDIINMLLSMNASKLFIFRHVKFPSAMINFFSGLRIAVTYSIMGAVIGEWLGGEKGLGVFMIRVRHTFDLEKFFAAIIVIVVLSLIMVGIVMVFEKILMPWKNKGTI
ncbi:MAG: ABC transporter permease [Endomicrobiaceae bacterium]|nr:ABC transporter permease [Endomicrobiaceae bacterium]